MNTLCERPASPTTQRTEPAGSLPALDAWSYLARLGAGTAAPSEPPVATATTATTAITAARPATAILPDSARGRLDPECLLAWRRNLADIRRAAAQSRAGAAGNRADAAAPSQPQGTAHAQDASLRA